MFPALGRWVCAALALLAIPGVSAALGIAIPPPAPDTHYVTASGSIQAAVDAASAGDTVEIRGVHNEAVTVGKQLAFVGVGAVLDGCGLGTHIVNLSSGVTDCSFSGIKFRFSDPQKSAIHLSGHNHRTSVTGCTFLGNDGTAVATGTSNDDSNSVLIEGCMFRGNYAGAQINPNYFWVQSGLIVRDCSFSRTSYAGVIASGSALVESCSFSFMEYGLSSFSVLLKGADGGSDPAGNTVRYCNFSRAHAISVTDTTATPILIDDLNGSKMGSGFLGASCKNASLTVQYCSAKGVFAGTGFGFGGGPGSILAQGNKIVNGMGTGIRLAPSGSSAVIDSCTVDNCDTGIEISTYSNGPASVKNCRITNCLYGLATYAGTNTIEACAVASTHVGALIHGGTTTLKTTKFTDGSGYAAIQVKQSTLYGATTTVAAVTGNTILNSMGHGIEVDRVNGTLVEGNLVQNSASVGICFYPWDASTSTTGTVIRSNVVTGCGTNTKGGIYCQFQTSPVIEYNTVTSAAGSGIKVEKCTGGTVYGNAVSKSERDGILVVYGSANEVDGNSVTSSGSEGIQVSWSPSSSVHHNVVNKSALRAIAVQGTLDTTASFGNTNLLGASIDPADWTVIPPAERPFTSP